MEVSVTNQAYIFLSSVAGGLIIGFVFDIFRILRKVVKTANFITYLEDILFWILAAIIIFALVFITNNGELRWYEFLGVLLGVIFYNLIFSSYVIKISVTVVNFIKKIVAWLIKVILFPIAFIYRIFKRPCRAFRRFIKRIAKKCARMFRKVGRKVGSSLKNVKVLLKKT